MIYTIEPFSLAKNLGQAYNDQIRHYSAEDWLIIKDIDTLFLLPDTVRHIHHYTEMFPSTGLFTCFTNRVGNKQQLLFNQFNNNADMRHHLAKAKNQTASLYRVTPMTKPISGFLMVIKKATWDVVQFSEDMQCLGVDNDYHNRLRHAGKSIYRMNGVYVWHTYRLLNGRRDKSHLTGVVEDLNLNPEQQEIETDDFTE